ncbi:uncharacterized protein (DUF1684 family) [Flavobacterium nitrogenifigens]|uniref:Uncharacterized protein (DUF1684 family) n=2 Tax=Flavobacterium TaxID=237 RepID=A0A7W7J1B1_9FLAO|nr:MULTISPECIES: DUF1684 domain-containing protein [Flavobacterium]MBB4804058.1 uncharacterized protein (DUF1684 family) [Flavobacterium nitrogenifigens]MBB6388790.1 uncharacterized protein (DUF1684 family) [Flavobacterium notoginsengisoli]
MKTIYALVLLFVFNFGFSQKKFSKNDVIKFQKKLNTEFADSKTSPLMAKDLKTFKGLEFYPISETFFVNATLVKAKGGKVIEMKESGKYTSKYTKYGTLNFKINGKAFKLAVYQNLELIVQEKYKNYLFLPFSDLTTGKQSYIGGRYIDLQIPKGNTIAIDFNQAYNPYCAYNYEYSCPLVPLENDLKIEIRAGVKDFH